MIHRWRDYTTSFMKTPYSLPNIFRTQLPAGGGPHDAAVPTRGFTRFPQIRLEGQANTMRPIRIYYPPQSGFRFRGHDLDSFEVPDLFSPPTPGFDYYPDNDTALAVIPRL